MSPTVRPESRPVRRELVAPATRRGGRAAAWVLAGFAVLGAGGTAAAAAGPHPGDTIPLGPLVAGWPDTFSVTGTKSEPLYTERIALHRAGDTFSVTIDVLSQGERPLGTQRSSVEIDVEGGRDAAVRWQRGCTKTPALCADDVELRGFLATAAVVALAAEHRLPDSAVVRDLHGRSVACIDDAALHPDGAPSPLRLDPCFDLETGAVLGHFSADSAVFTGATLAPGMTVSSP